MKAPSPLLGFNNNVKHKGRVFHIQTEDSGVKHPHIITHLFADGGRILKTKKTSYAEHLEDDGMSKMVRGMMQEQHKAMFIALRAGKFDPLIEGMVDSTGEHLALDATGERKKAVPPPPPEPEKVAAPTPPVEEASGTLVPSKTLPPESKTKGPPPISPTPPPRPAKPTPIQVPGGVAAGPRPNVTRAFVPAAVPDDQAPATERAGTRATPSSLARAVASEPDAAEHDDNIELDLVALERAAKAAEKPYYQDIHNLPPPPAAVLRNTSPTPPEGTIYRTIGPSTRSSLPPPEPPREREAASRRAKTAPSHSGQPRPSDVPPPSTPGTGRYAPSRPAAIFGNTARPAEGTSIFGDELISEKSLDEVILSYLAEDLDGPNKK